MNYDKLRRTKDHLHKTLDIFYIWDSIITNKQVGKVVFHNKTLGTMNYNLYQMLYIKTAVFFEVKGKHSIEKILNLMPKSDVKFKLLSDWQIFKNTYSEIIGRIELLRNKYFAHYDDIEIEEVIPNLAYNPQLLLLLNQVEHMIVVVWKEMLKKDLPLYNPKEIRELTIETLIQISYD